MRMALLTLVSVSPLLLPWAQPQATIEDLPPLFDVTSGTTEAADDENYADNPENALQMLLQQDAAELAYPHNVSSGIQAKIRILNFNTNRFTDKTIQVNQPYAIDGIKVILRDCRRDYQRRQQDIAWLDILSLRPPITLQDIDNQNQPNALFRGWMFNTHPSAHALDHAAYDVRVLSCA